MEFSSGSIGRIRNARLSLDFFTFLWCCWPGKALGVEDVFYVVDISAEAHRTRACRGEGRFWLKPREYLSWHDEFSYRDRQRVPVLPGVSKRVSKNFTKSYLLGLDRGEYKKLTSEVASTGTLSLIYCMSRL